ncbi:RimJ/RimL family protein N-acetyltransferase [Kribbella voronezhensis]|uniref:RimJ/RimL family protein N-acetyltransferase n=1 Tax=Kribbella voronezhensis TaxID=2512212 RepID=A0A4R7SV78_9ACTN|nr:GNAT family protein [Kribbella voronezhensis]TDU83141.1 RimJ/RimL family protein N-acetyltransferase [Kribbella voronezhensis]
MDELRLRPVQEKDLDYFAEFAVEQDEVGISWQGFRAPRIAVKRFEEDGYLGADSSRLIVESGGETAGFVSWFAGSFDDKTKYWEIGAALRPQYRGRGIGWRAQAMVTDYLFEHTPVERIQAATQPENVAEQKSLLKAGFQFEGVIRACEFRAGQYRDAYLYSRLRSDPAVAIDR